ncbi:hypothetical protein [Teredinibacter haidensis]|uniref:hypothetical protein n=1 Tax=Teredinibacter haidensis TaxID=2731755 RepID=UPI0009490594|nr:hypothetical protein [Teredinibacter haidensis]
MKNVLIFILLLFYSASVLAFRIDVEAGDARSVQLFGVCGDCSKSAKISVVDVRLQEGQWFPTTEIQFKGSTESEKFGFGIAMYQDGKGLSAYYTKGSKTTVLKSNLKLLTTYNIDFEYVGNNILSFSVAGKILKST